MSVMTAHDTPSGTRMMWKASVNAICDRAHGTGSIAVGIEAAVAKTSSTVMAAHRLSRGSVVCDVGFHTGRHCRVTTSPDQDD